MVIILWLPNIKSKYLVVFEVVKIINFWLSYFSLNYEFSIVIELISDFIIWLLFSDDIENGKPKEE